MNRSLLFVSLLIKTKFDHVKCNPTYKKPIPSNGPCIDSIERLEKATIDTTFECLGCYEVTQSICPSGILNCQMMIDDIYRNCDKVNIPSRFFYDPPVSNKCLQI